MTHDLYRSSYRHLDIEPGCTWQEVRRAYKRSVKKWHPDHYHNDAKTQSLAAEKIKEINCAFDLLSEHYRTHGALPLPGEPPVTPPYVARDTHPQGAHPAPGQSEQPVDHSPADSVEHHHQPPTQQKHGSGVATRLVLAALVLWFGYTLWLAPPVPQESSAPESSDPPADTTPPSEAATIHQPDPEQPKHYFTYGSTVGDVYAIQGIPTKTTDNIWHYGKSKVYFNGGKVTRWVDDPTSPLKASADVSLDPTGNTAFGIGSTKAQVRAIQGEPLQEWANVWEYGMSKVYFDGDRVSGWYDSALNPLLVRK